MSVFKFPIWCTNKESDIEAGNVSVQNLKADYIENFVWKDETQINKQTNTKISLVYIFLFQEISKTRILFPFPFCNLKNTS